MDICVRWCISCVLCYHRVRVVSFTNGSAATFVVCKLCFVFQRAVQVLSPTPNVYQVAHFCGCFGLMRTHSSQNCCDCVAGVGKVDEIFDMGEEDKKVLALQLADWDSARRSKVRSLDNINRTTYALWTNLNDQTEFIVPVQKLASGLVNVGLGAYSD